MFDKLLLPPRDFEIVCGRSTRDIWPGIWELLSHKQKHNAIVDLRVKSEKVDDTSNKEGYFG